MTWDDVRVSRKGGRARLALAVAGLLAVVVAGALVARSREPTVAAAPPPVVAARKARPSSARGRADDSFCGALARWANTSVLQLAPRTAAYCAMRLPSI